MFGAFDKSELLAPFIEKLEKKELNLEDILDNENIILDLRTNSDSKFLPFLSYDNMKKLLDYCLKMPEVDDPKKGYKFPFNATEIICSYNLAIIDKLFEKITDEEEKKEDDKKEEEKKEDKKEDDKKEEDKKEDKKEEKKEDKKEEEKKEEKKEDKKEEEKIEEKKEDKKEEEKKEDKKEDNKKEEDKKAEDKKAEEKKEEEIKKKYSTLLDYYFDFLNDNPTNEDFVLVGYFNKILNHILINRSTQILSYIYNENWDEIMKGLIKHLNRRSIGECIKMILTYNDDIINTEEMKKKKLIFFEKILQDLNDSTDEEKYFCVCDTLNNCFTNKDFFFLFMTNEELVKLLFSILCGKINNDGLFKILLNLMIKINEKILLLFDKLVTPNLYVETHSDTLFNNDEDENQTNKEEQLKSILIYIFKESTEYFLIIFEDLNIYPKNEFETTYQQNQLKLGYKKLIQIEYFRSVIDILVNTYSKNYFVNNLNEYLKKEELKLSKIFWMLHNIFFKFEFNNIYQTLYLQLMTIILNENTPENLLNSVFINKDNENEKLIPKLLDNCINTKIFKYLSEREANSCSLASNIKLLHDINNSNNQYIKKLIENENDFKVFNEVLVSEIYTKFNGKLLFNELNGFPTQFNTISDVEMSVRSVEQLYNEDLNIYNTYKNGGNYKTLFEEKLKRDEEEKKIDTNLLATSQLASSIVLSNPDENENNKEEKIEEEEKEEEKKEEKKEEEKKEEKKEEEKKEEKKEEEKKEEEKKEEK